MSDKTYYQAAEDAHTGPIKNPRQLLTVVAITFIGVVLVIVALVMFVASGTKPAGTAKGDNMSLYGMSTAGRDHDIQARLAKVGAVEIRDANRPLAQGESVFKAQCVACHGTPGIPGAPHYGDAAAWGPRIGQGYATLLGHALKGKGAMPPQGGGDFNDTEIGRAVVYMANAGGAKFAVPERAASDAATADAPAADANAAVAAAPAAATAPAAAAPITQVAMAAAPAAAAPAAAAPAAGGSNAAAGEALYKQTCFACHGAGVAGAPKFGDKAAWAPRIQTGMDTLVAAAIKGKGAMPPKGGSSASDADVHAAVEYMVSAAK